ncbi:MAG: nucleotide exchange factor GrpE [Firmicutes bacterium]|nr:nucleotide exchange factor GrpE [Bacillota bacterium]
MASSEKKSRYRTQTVETIPTKPEPGKQEGSDKIAKLQLELELTQAESKKNWERALFERAELENFRKRNADNISKAYSDGQTSVIMQILPIGDSLNEALKSVDNPLYRVGIEIMRKKFDEVLTNLGVEEIPALNEPFNPNVHNAVAAEAHTTDGKPTPPDTVIEVWQNGYRLGGRVIRPSTVKVSS